LSRIRANLFFQESYPMSKSLALAALVLAGTLATVPAFAESIQAGDFTIHANAFAANTLDPEIARRIGLERGKHRGILNVTVVKAQPGIAGASSTALVEARIVKPDDRQAAIPMREIRDGEAISYLGEFPVQDPTSLEFEIRVRPAGVAEAQTIRMSQELFAE
jgi:hypothetical protein